MVAASKSGPNVAPKGAHVILQSSCGGDSLPGSGIAQYWMKRRGHRQMSLALFARRLSQPLHGQLCGLETAAATAGSPGSGGVWDEAVP